MILLILMIYFVGRQFYELAHEYDKSRWGFAILGVVSYYIGLYSGAVLVGIVLEIVAPGFVESTSEFVLGLIPIPIGIATCWLTYVLLKRSWSKPKETSKQTLDAELMSPNPNRYNQEEN
jgi:ABC-type Co2+ transport system permease subunit